MDYQSLHSKTVVELRRLAREMQVKLPAGLSKAEIVERILEAQPVPSPAKAAGTQAVEAVPEEASASEAPADAPAEDSGTDERAPEKIVAPGVVLRERRMEMPPDAVVNRYAVPQSQRAAVSRPQENFSRNPENQNYRPVRTSEPYPRRMYTDQQRRPQEGYRNNYEPSYSRSESRQESSFYNRNENYSRNEGYSRGESRTEGYGAGRFVQDNTYRAASDFRTLDESEMIRPRRDYTESGPDGMPIGDFADGAGLLEIQPDGYGFLRAENCLPGSRDAYISAAQIRRFNLKNGDYVEGKTRPQREGDRYSAMIYISGINGEDPEKALTRKPFDSLIPLYPRERLRMECESSEDMSLRLMDILAPIGKGQRGMIVSQPKAGKTTLLKKVANAISENNPEVKLIVLLIDERPEEVTDMKRSIKGDVIYSTFDEAPENHTRVAEMVLEHAQRMVEMGKDVVILMDSITRLARAYNLVIPPTGRSLSGGLDPGALYKPKKFFGAARNIENGGSLTIIATALVDTGSRMDDIIYEEFKGTGNMELHLDRKLSDKRIFPAIDLVRSGTRREELLLSPKELDGAYTVRKMLSGSNVQENMEMLLNLMEKATDNDDFLSKIKSWVAVYEKDGFSIG